MTREQKMQAVVEALKALVMACELPGDHCEVEQALPTARDALATLDAHTEAQEVVTLEAWSHADGDVVLVLPASPLAREYPVNEYRRRLGIVTLPLTPEGGR